MFGFLLYPIRSSGETFPTTIRLGQNNVPTSNTVNGNRTVEGKDGKRGQERYVGMMGEKETSGANSAMPLHKCLLEFKVGSPTQLLGSGRALNPEAEE